MDDQEARERYERMWQRRKRVMDEIARKDWRREQEAIFRTLMDRKGDADESKRKRREEGD